MESNIILEGFKKSVEMHGLIYFKIIGDGDSSVYKRIMEQKLYGNLLVEKVECKNHLMRNFIHKLRDISSKYNNLLGECSILIYMNLNSRKKKEQ